MSPAAKSVYYFGLYLYLVGITLIVVPNFLLSCLQLPPTNEVWIRVVGVLVFCIGYYYHKAGQNNIGAFFIHTIPTRLFVFAAFIFFALMQYASPLLIIFGAVDFAGAMWTLLALRKENK